MPKGFKGFQKGHAPWHKGKTGVYSKEVLQRMSKAHKGKKQSAIAIEKTRLSNIGRKVSEKTKKKISLALKGKKVSKEARENMSKAQKGRVVSEETKKKISKGSKGKKMSAEAKRKMSEAKSGKKSPFWKGGISFEPYSVDWTKTFKRSIRERDHYVCQLCSQYGNHIHHIDYDKKNCCPDNLITLCNSCHSKTNNNRKKWTSYFQKLREDIEEIMG